MGRRSLKSDFIAAVAARCFLRLEVGMLTGDARPTAVAVAHKVGCFTSSQEVRVARRTRRQRYRAGG